MEIVSADREMGSAAAEENLDIFERAKEAQVQASAKLAATLRQMVNDPVCSDVTFLCNDGERVHASKMLLVGRSDVLKCMFKNGMAESNLSEIKMPKMSSIVLLAVFEFLYTGTVLDHHPQSWRMSCEMIVAAQFFLLPELDIFIRKFMLTQIHRVAEDLPKVASLLTEAVGFQALCNEMDVSLRVLVKILNSNLSDSTFIQSLSEDACNYFLAKSKGKLEDLDKHSFREYLRFRQVILWWVYNGRCISWEELDFYAPDLESVMVICRDQSNLEVVECPQEETENTYDEWNTLQSDVESKNAAIRLLSNIDYRCIHPAILQKVVEPLKISSAEVMSAFRFHALRRPMVSKTLEWELGESYGIAEQGSVIHSTGRGTGTGIAVMKAAMSKPCGLFEWNFILDEAISGVLELGFLYTDESKVAWKPKLDRNVRQHLGRVLIVSKTLTLVNYQGPNERNLTVLKSRVKENSPLLFRFNAFDNTCDVECDGTNFKNIWTDLPSRTYYPAVSFSHTYKGRVRIELLRGFDIL